MPSIDELFYSSAERVSALCEGRDYPVFEGYKCRAFLQGCANRSGIDRVKKTLTLTLHPLPCENVTLLSACSLDPPRISCSTAYGKLCAQFGNINYLLIAATFLQSDLCVLAGCKWFSQGISQILVSRAVMVGVLWPALPLESPVSIPFCDFSVASPCFSTFHASGELWMTRRKKWSLMGSGTFVFDAGEISCDAG